MAPTPPSYRLIGIVVLESESKGDLTNRYSLNKECTHLFDFFRVQCCLPIRKSETMNFILRSGKKFQILKTIVHPLMILMIYIQTLWNRSLEHVPNQPANAKNFGHTVFAKKKTSVSMDRINDWTHWYTERSFTRRSDSTYISEIANFIKSFVVADWFPMLDHRVYYSAKG